MGRGSRAGGSASGGARGGTLVVAEGAAGWEEHGGDGEVGYRGEETTAT